MKLELMAVGTIKQDVPGIVKTETRYVVDGAVKRNVTYSPEGR